jgi:hypothetical protein
MFPVRETMNELYEVVSTITCVTVVHSSFRVFLTSAVVFFPALGGALFRVSDTGYKGRTVLVFVEVYPLARADFCAEAHSSGEPLGKASLG